MRFDIKKTFSFLAVLCGIACFGCAMAQDVPSTGGTHPVAVAAAVATGGYKLGAGDKIRIIVFGEDNLGGEFVVSGTGKVSLPLIGEIDATGYSASELQDHVADALRQGYLKDPKVNVEVLTFRPFYILGEVNKPGEYPYSDGMTVMNAVATAQGFTYRANKKTVYIKHANDNSEVTVKLTGSLMVQPGDTVRISERYF